LKRIRKSTEVSANYHLVTEKVVDQLMTEGGEERQLRFVPSVNLHMVNGESGEKRALVGQEQERRIDSGTAGRHSIISLVLDPAEVAAVDSSKEFIDLLRRLVKQASTHSSAILLRGPTAPEHLKALFALGVDIFESSYAAMAADDGVALLMDVDSGTTERLQLGDAKYFDDFSPLSSSCECIACHGPDRTTRSYVHHLIRTSEMLAGVFLASHNLWQYANFVRNLPRMR
jgi:predicted RNA-binding protein